MNPSSLHPTAVDGNEPPPAPETDEEDDECRVCRVGASPSNPLYKPCLCKGSAGFMHQACLEEWLKAGSRTKCELCAYEYKFEPLYSKDCPQHISSSLVLLTSLKMLFVKNLPRIFRILTGLLIWLGLVPLWASMMHRYFRNDYVQFNEQLNITSGSIGSYYSSWPHLKADIVAGLVIIGEVVLFVVILMSFHDLVGAFINNNGNEPAVGNPQAAPAAPAAQAPMAVPHGPVHDNNNNNNNEDVGIGLANAHLNGQCEEDIVAQVMDEIIYDIGVNLLIDEALSGGAHRIAELRAEAVAAKAVLRQPNVEASICANHSKQVNRKGGGENDFLGKDDDGDDNGSNGSEDDWVRVPKPSISSIDSNLSNLNGDSFVESRLPVDINKNSILESPPHLSSVNRDDSNNSNGDSVHVVNDDTDADQLGELMERELLRDEANVDQLGELLERELLRDEVLENDDDDDDDYDDDDDNDDGEDDDDDIDIDDINGADGARLNAAFNDDFGDGGDGLDPQGGIRIADLFGFGNVTNLIKNAVIFISVLSLIIIMLFWIPSYFAGVCNWTILSYAPPFIKSFFVSINAQLVKNNAVILLSELFTSAIGFRNITLMIGFLFKTIQFSERFILGNAFYTREFSIYLKHLERVASVTKISMLLLSRILLLPIGLGHLLIFIFNRIYGFSRDSWIEYAAQATFGCIMLSWTTGICYMLVITLSVLQLREIFHPKILGSIIRPQETHAELVQSLVDETLLTHARRLLVSVAVYLVLAVLLMYVPISIGLYFQLLPTDLRIWYFIPELQMPYEIGVAHFLMLHFLEKKKNSIGKFLHIALVFFSDHFGVTKFVLPCPLKLSEESDLTSTVVGPDGELMVGRPLMRPPKGWEVRDNQRHNIKVTTRWAWLGEDPSDLEKKVAPQQLPKSHGVLRLTGFAVFCVLLTVFIVLFGITVPIRLGREVVTRLGIPVKFQHDPVSTIIGGIVLLKIFNFVDVHITSKNSLSQIIKFFRRGPSSSVKKIVLLVASWNLCHVLIGMLAIYYSEFISHQYVVDEAARSILFSESVYNFQFWKEAIIGKRLVTLLVISYVIRGGLKNTLTRIGIGPVIALDKLENWTGRLKAAFSQLYDAIIVNRGETDTYADLDASIEVITQLLLEPFINHLKYVASMTTIARLLIQQYRLDVSHPRISAFAFLLPLMCSIIVGVFPVLYHISAKALKRIEKQFRDDNYLIGQKLVNSSPGPISS